MEFSPFHTVCPSTLLLHQQVFLSGTPPALCLVSLPYFWISFFLMRIGYGEAESCAGASPTALGERRGRQLPGAAGTSLQEKAGKNWQGVESSGKQIRKPAPIYRPAARNCPGGGATAVTLPAPSTSPKRAPLVPRWGWGKQGRPRTVLGLEAALYGGPPRQDHDGRGLRFSRDRGGTQGSSWEGPSKCLATSKPKMFPLRKRQ